MNDYYSLEILIREKTREYEQAAGLIRLRKIKKGKGSAFAERAWAWLGDFLIRLGRTIKLKYGPKPVLICSSNGFGHGNLHESGKGCKVDAEF